MMEKLLADIDAEAIVVFGSRAAGTHRNDSEYDIAIVLSPKRERGQSHVDDFQLPARTRHTEMNP